MLDILVMYKMCRFESDMLAFSGCYYGGGEKEVKELGLMRKRWKTLHVGVSFVENTCACLYEVMKFVLYEVLLLVFLTRNETLRRKEEMGNAPSLLRKWELC